MQRLFRGLIQRLIKRLIPWQRLVLLLLAAIGSLMPAAAQAAALASGRCTPPGTGYQFVLSTTMLVISCIWQMLITTAVAELNHAPRLVQWCTPHLLRRSLVTFIGVGLIAVGLMGDILMWATVLRHLKLFATLNESFYFSAMTFTTVGYGDVVLPPCWHLLSVAIAVTGLLMAGWSTALLVFVVQRTMAMRFNSENRT
jgi:hypothetical protein